ncbi:hypothetical protein [Dyella japonica]|uniref:hypothetical protein n=1 Tax=Dyella japonica TaxID=231455 RepID=UPI0011864A27|nr:hypothetical protein [Dyella japonica]
MSFLETRFGQFFGNSILRNAGAAAGFPCGKRRTSRPQRLLSLLFHLPASTTLNTNDNAI